MDDPLEPNEPTAQAPPAGPSQQETADYIAAQTVGLMRMAASADMPLLAYLLSKAAKEAMKQGGMPRRRRSASSKKAPAREGRGLKLPAGGWLSASRRYPLQRPPHQPGQGGHDRPATSARIEARSSVSRLSVQLPPISM